MGAGGVRAGATVDTRAAHADLHAFVAGGLRVDAWLVGQHIGDASHAALFDLGHIHHIGGPGDALELLARGLYFTYLFAGDLQ